MSVIAVPKQVYITEPTNFMCPECGAIQWMNKGYHRAEDMYCSFCRGDYLDYDPIPSERKRVLARLRAGKKVPRLVELP